MKLVFLAVVVTLAAAVAASPVDVNSAWANFKVTYGKEYRGLYEETVRKAIFIENFNRIAEHNERFAQGLVSYSLKINEYSDMSAEEFNKTMNGYKKGDISAYSIDIQQFKPDPNVAVPNEIDWRSQGAVTNVKNQGNCGSCWSFSSTGALEGQLFRKTGSLRSASEQNLMDCSTSQGNGGCDGGNMDAAFAYVYENDGIDSEESYPYEARDGTCRYTVQGKVTSDRGYALIQNGNEEHLKAAIAQIGPIAVAMDASPEDFGSYSSGVYYNSACSSTILNHGVLAVGYGTENGQDYWLIKNSWGATWGANGYVKIARNRNNVCGIATDASYPLNK